MTTLNRRRRWAVALVVPFLLVLSACAENAPQDTLEPKGPVARQIDNLINPVFIIAGVIFVLVQFLVVYCVVKFRHREGRPEPVQIHGNTRLELAWTLIPAFILLGVAVPTIRTIFDLARAPEDPVNVTVIGHQFWWEYRYDDYGILTANELHIPTGRPVEMKLESVDVVHSFWIPPLGGKQDVVPGRTNRMSFEADRPGTYLGQCAEFCGTSHANMRATAVAHPPDEFDEWVRNQQQAARPAPAGTPEAEGEALITSKGCAGCHTIQGIAQGTVGPNLTHFMTREIFAGGIFENTPGNLRAWLRDPPAEKPGSRMPNLGLSPDEVNKLVQYLETLR